MRCAMIGLLVLMSPVQADDASSGSAQSFTVRVGPKLRVTGQTLQSVTVESTVGLWVQQERFRGHKHVASAGRLILAGQRTKIALKEIPSEQRLQIRETAASRRFTRIAAGASFAPPDERAWTIITFTAP